MKHTEVRVKNPLHVIRWQAIIAAERAQGLPFEDGNARDMIIAYSTELQEALELTVDDLHHAYKNYQAWYVGPWAFRVFTYFWSDWQPVLEVLSSSKVQGWHHAGSGTIEETLPDAMTRRKILSDIQDHDGKASMRSWLPYDVECYVTDKQPPQRDRRGNLIDEDRTWFREQFRASYDTWKAKHRDPETDARHERI